MDLTDISIDDLQTLFANSLVRYNKKPVLIKTITGARCAFCTYLDDKGKSFEIPISDTSFDFEPVPLGFINHKGEVYWSARLPSRQWSQGLTSKNLVVSPLTGDAKNSDTLLHIKEILTLKTKSLLACIEGSYPSLRNAIRLIDTGANSVAFKRNLAITAEGDVFFKNKQVGVWKEDGEIVTKRGCKFIEEVLYA